MLTSQQQPKGKRAMRKRFLGFAAGGLLLIATAACVDVMNVVTTTDLEPSGTDVLVSGTLNSRSLAQFEAYLENHPETTRLVLLDIPGSVDDEINLQLGHLVRDYGLDTHLTADSEIHSGGVDLFIAGVERSMEEGAILGVHAWGNGDFVATDFPHDDPVHQSYVDYTERMLGDAAFYWYTIEAAPVETTHEMRDDEIRRYGMLTQPIIRN